MNFFFMRHRRLRLLAGLMVLASAASAAAPRIEISYTPELGVSSYTGRVFLLLTTDSHRDPREMLPWKAAGPIYAFDVEDWKPDTTIPLPGNVMRVGAPLDNLPAGEYRAVAVIDLNRWTHNVLYGPGNGRSRFVEFAHTPEQAVTLSLRIDDMVPHWKLADRDNLKYVRLRSRMLSQFYGREVTANAVVSLPEAYLDEPSRNFPAVYVISGFGGDIRTSYWRGMGPALSACGLDAVVIYIDADCPTGHHVFADSANNGPVGTSLVEELIPHLEKEFRLIPETHARFVTGHSSGGWASLWLQITHPDVFGGCWSTSPDPVDFSAFQTVNIYEQGANIFFESSGEKRPLSRGTPMGQLWAKDLSELEDVLGRGGQLSSFEAVFSPRGPDGGPRKLWDRKTGLIDPAVAEAWRKYDIRLILEKNWSALGPKLAGKLYLYCGDQDTFFLERAFLRLKDALERIEAEAYIEVVPGASHSLPMSTFAQTYRQMAEHYARATQRSESK